jgi:hypothetical protein
VLGLRLHCGEHGDDVVQRLPRLCGEVVAVEHALRVPADLAGREQQAAARGDAVGTAARTRPSWGKGRACVGVLMNALPALCRIVPLTPTLAAKLARDADVEGDR